MEKKRVVETQEDDRSVKRRKTGSSQFSFRRSEGHGWDAQAGCILRVRLKNFMNHAEYEYSPTQRLNFINGSNGSGKSAVLTAIVFGLGGTARMSNRGSSNNGLIRMGQNQTVVEITLHNSGENAYKPEIYGDCITIVRTASSSGGGGYKIKNEQGRIVKDKKAKQELVRILDAFNIQIDNPIAILNQDSAKTFLFKCDATKLYEFFMKATQLEECKRSYNLANIEKNAASDLLGDKVRNLDELHSQVKKWEEKFKFFKRMDRKRDDLDNLKAELGWSMVKKVQSEVLKVQENIEKSATKIDMYQQKIAKDAERRKELMQEKRNIERQIQNVATDTAKLQAELEEVNGELKNVRLTEKNAAKTSSELERKMKAKRTEADALRSAIAKIRSGESEREFELEMERRKSEIDRLEANRSEMEAQISSRQTHMGNLKATMDAFRQQEQEMKSKQQDLKSSYEKKSKEIMNIQSRADNKLFLFGDKMPELVDLIEKNLSRFKVAPIGPVGSHVELARDVTPQEGQIIERELRQQLMTFLVSNHDDCRILQSLSTRSKVKIPIVTTHFTNQLYEVSKHKCVTPKYKTILDRLIIKNPNVTNYLLDAKSIEKVIIVPDENEAFDLLNDVATVPKNCRYALTLNFGQYYPAPSSRSYSVHPGKNVTQVLQTSVGELLEKYQIECKSLKASFEEASNEMKDYIKQRMDREKEFFLLEESVKELNGKCARVGAQLMKIRSEESTSKPPDISALEEDIERAEEELSEMEINLAKLKHKFSEAKEKCQEVFQLLEQKEEAVQACIRGSEPLTESLATIEATLSKDNKHKDHYREKIKEHTEKKEQHENALKKANAKLGQQVENASQWSKKQIETSRDPEDILREISVLKESLSRLEAASESRMEVAENYEKLSLFYNEVNRQVSTLKDTIDNLCRMLLIRKNGFLKIRAMVSRRIQVNFKNRLQSRNFMGELKFDHKNKLLDIFVNPSGGQGGDASRKRDLKGLSGGEKSYTTISLILAMWESIHPPFRCLDEFDVFMDSVNRRVALDQIISYAKETRDFQYILLTPLSVDSIAGDKDIQIIQIQKNDG